MSYDFGNRQRASVIKTISNSYRELLAGAVCCLALCLLSGCGGGAEAVPSGTVVGTVTSNGKPLGQGVINFTSSTTGTGVYIEMQPDGTYELPSAIPAGEYRVFFSTPNLGDVPPPEPGQAAPPNVLKDVPEKYQSEQTTDLQVQVKEGANTFDFELKP